MKPLAPRLAVHGLSAAVLAFLVLPIAIIIPVSLSPERYLHFPPSGVSWQWYRVLWTAPGWVESAWLSLRVAGLATVAGLVLGLSIAVALVRARFPGRAAVYALVLSPMIVPSIITAIALYFLFARLRWIGSPLGMAVGATIPVLPVVVIIVTATLQGFDQRLEQAAVGLGASPLRAFRRVTVPLISPGIVAAALFAFLTAFNELLIPLFLSDATTMTLSVRIWNSVLMQIEPTVAAVSTILIVVALLVVTISGSSRQAAVRWQSRPRG